MQDHPIPCNTMQFYALQCNTMQYHSSFITADGAYHCPVGSKMAIFVKVTVTLEIMTKIYNFYLSFLVCQPNFDISKENAGKPNFSKVIKKLEIIKEMAKMLN